MGHLTKPRLDTEDIKLMKMIAKHGFVDMYYIRLFYKKGCQERTVNDRVHQLAKHKYLAILKTFIPPEYTMVQKTAYMIVCLGKEGLALMRYYGIMTDDHSSALKTAAPYRMYHQIQVATVCDMIRNQFKNSNSVFEVYKILNEKEAFLEQTNNMPDALILFKMKDNSYEGLIAVFLELERSYTSVKRVSNKLLRYSQSFIDKIYTKKFNLPIVDHRVLFVAQTSGQYTGLKKKIEGCENSKDLDVLLTSYTEVCNESTKEIYCDIRRDKKIKLLSKMDHDNHINDSN